MIKAKNIIEIRKKKKERKRQTREYVKNAICQLKETENKKLIVMTLQDLFKWVETFNFNDVQNDNESTEAYIARLLKKYRSELQSVTNIVINDQAVWNQLLEDVEDLNNVLIDSLQLYSQAKIADSIARLHSILTKTDKLLQLSVSPSQECDKNWYRMRNQEDGKRVFPANEMFHIPFNLRHKVSLARYSVSGYPCLYISRSVWATWEEMHEPKLSDFSVSRLELQHGFQVLDLRVPVWSDPVNISQLIKQLYTIPLILSCSVKVKYPRDNFKPEYIIPQLVMLAITYPDVDFVGCAYTSTMRNPVFNWANIRLLDNIALPVYSVNPSYKLCPKLTSFFKVSDSTNYDYELLKEPFSTLFMNVIDEALVVEGAQKYSSSVFGQIESRLAQMEVKQL
jgi:hypothetical protein